MLCVYQGKGLVAATIIAQAKVPPTQFSGAGSRGHFLFSTRGKQSPAPLGTASYLPREPQTQMTALG